MSKNSKSKKHSKSKRSKKHELELVDPEDYDISDGSDDEVFASSSIPNQPKPRSYDTVMGSVEDQRTELTTDPRFRSEMKRKAKTKGQSMKAKSDLIKKAKKTKKKSNNELRKRELKALQQQRIKELHKIRQRKDEVISNKMDKYFNGDQDQDQDQDQYDDYYSEAQINQRYNDYDALMDSIGTLSNDQENNGTSTKPQHRKKRRGKSGQGGKVKHMTGDDDSVDTVNELYKSKTLDRVRDFDRPLHHQNFHFKNKEAKRKNRREVLKALEEFDVTMEELAETSRNADKDSDVDSDNDSDTERFRARPNVDCKDYISVDPLPPNGIQFAEISFDVPPLYVYDEIGALACYGFLKYMSSDFELSWKEFYTLFETWKMENKQKLNKILQKRLNDAHFEGAVKVRYAGETETECHDYGKEVLAPGDNIYDIMTVPIGVWTPFSTDRSNALNFDSSNERLNEHMIKKRENTHKGHKLFHARKALRDRKKQDVEARQKEENRSAEREGREARDLREEARLDELDESEMRLLNTVVDTDSLIPDMVEEFRGRFDMVQRPKSKGKHKRKKSK